METDVALLSAYQSLPTSKPGSSPCYGWSGTFSSTHFPRHPVAHLHIGSNTRVLTVETPTFFISCALLFLEGKTRSQSRVPSQKHDEWQSSFPVSLFWRVICKCQRLIWTKETSSSPAATVTVRLHWISSAKTVNHEPNFIRWRLGRLFPATSAWLMVSWNYLQMLTEEVVLCLLFRVGYWVEEGYSAILVTTLCYKELRPTLWAGDSSWRSSQADVKEPFTSLNIHPSGDCRVHVPGDRTRGYNLSSFLIQ